MNLNSNHNVKTNRPEITYAGDFTDRAAAMTDLRKLLMRSMQAINAGLIRGPIELGHLARGLEIIATQYSTFPDESDPSFGNASDLFSEGASGVWPPGEELSKLLEIDFEKFNQEFMDEFESRLRNKSSSQLGSASFVSQLDTQEGAA